MKQPTRHHNQANSKTTTTPIEEKLARARLAKAARKLKGSLSGEDIPGWETSESAAEWVRASRRADDEKLDRAWRGSGDA